MLGSGDAGCTRTRSCHLWSLTYPALPAARVIPPTMSKRTKSKPQERGYVLFDVMYEDGSRASNRRVPVSVLGGLEGDEAARRVIEEQDEAIAAKSGRPRLPIQQLTRSKV
jgi:hypothetical protein